LAAKNKFEFKPEIQISAELKLLAGDAPVIQPSSTTSKMEADSITELI
jgi:hypothetical protein